MKCREEELRRYFRVRHVFLVSSGKAALYLILKGLRSLFPERDEVIIPAYTCFSVPSAIVKAGLKVKPCDIDQDTFDFNQSCLKAAINSKTLCVIPGHLFGIPSDMDAINDLCRSRGVVVVEDAAQSMGGKYKNRRLGTIGDVGFFSLGRGKNITCGAGGIILADKEAIASAINKEYVSINSPTVYEDLAEFFKLFLMVFFIKPTLYWLPASAPFLRLGETIFYRDFPVKKLSNSKAGILTNWQLRLEKSNNIRKENAHYICRKSGIKPAVRSLEDVVFLRLPIVLEDSESRDALYSVSREKGLGLSRMYPTPVNEIEEISEQMNNMSFPVSKSVSERLLNIPTHQLLSQRDKDMICSLMNKTTYALKQETQLCQ